MKTVVLNYADFTIIPDMTEFCKANTVIFDLKLYDIPHTMRRDIKKCAELGGYAVTVADHPGNYPGMVESKKAGEEYGIKIIVGDVDLTSDG